MPARSEGTRGPLGRALRLVARLCDAGAPLLEALDLAAAEVSAAFAGRPELFPEAAVAPVSLSEGIGEGLFLSRRSDP